MPTFGVIEDFDQIKYISSGLTTRSINTACTRSILSAEKKLSMAELHRLHPLDSCGTWCLVQPANYGSARWCTGFPDPSDALTYFDCSCVIEPSSAYPQSIARTCSIASTSPQSALSTSPAPPLHTASAQPLRCRWSLPLTSDWVHWPGIADSTRCQQSHHGARDPPAIHACMASFEGLRCQKRAVYLLSKGVRAITSSQDLWFLQNEPKCATQDREWPAKSSY